MPFFRERSECFCQQFEFSRFQRRFPRFGQEANALYPDEIPKVEELEILHCLGANLLLVEIDLDSSGRIPKIDEVAFAHVAMRGQATGNTQGLSLTEFFANFCDGAIRLERSAERIDTFCAQGLEFLTPLCDQFVFGLHLL